MLSPSEQVALNVERAREMRQAGRSYREIRRELDLTSSQIGHVKRALKREKAGQTRLRNAGRATTDRDLPVSQSTLPAGLRKQLTASGYRTLGDLADRIGDPELTGLETTPGIGPHRMRLMKGLLDHYALLSGPSDLQAAVEALFPELSYAPGERRE